MYRQIHDNGFTLFELIVVLAIISAMTAIVVPYANRTGRCLQTREEARNIGAIIRYAIESVKNNEHPLRLVINTKQKSYWLERNGNNKEFKGVEGFYGQPRYLDEKIFMLDIDGFSLDGDEWQLTFSSDVPWPKASVSIGNKDVLEKIVIKGKKVIIEETSG